MKTKKPLSIVAIDIGGSSIKAALLEISENGGQKFTKFGTTKVVDDSLKALKASVCEKVLEVCGNCSGEVLIGISTTGSVRSNSIVARGGFFKGYEDFNWEDVLVKSGSILEGTKVTVANDGQCAAMGVYRTDTKVGIAKSLFHVSIGTGVGGGIVLDGNILRGDHGFAGNIGHIKVGGNRQCVCQATGCLETFVSAGVFETEFRRMTKKSLRFHEIMSEPLSEAHQIIFSEMANYLGQGLADAMNLLDTDLISLGGGFMDAVREQKDNTFISSVIKCAHKYAIKRISDNVEIFATSVGNDAALYGAAYIAMEDGLQK